MKTSISAAALVAFALFGGTAHAAKILAPVSVTVNSGGTAGSFWTVDNVIDQSGLNKTYVAGVTEFEDFIASNPRHGDSLNTRWTTPSGIASARLTFDFGREVTLSQLAFWDDHSTSNSFVRLSTPDLVNFATLAPTEATMTSFPAQVFSFRPVTTRYLTFDFEGCDKGRFLGCSLKEVAFAEGVAGVVPEPATWAMMILGFGGVGALLRRRAGMAAA
jgi:hypothetical protein